MSCDGPDGQWHATDVDVACTASDGGSGLAEAADASFSLSTAVPAGTETPHAATASRQVCDAAGNCATAGPLSGHKVDKLGPTATIAHPVAGATYVLAQAVTASYDCADGGSGLADCLGTEPGGARSTRPRWDRSPSG